MQTKSSRTTVWIFHDFSTISQILHETNFGYFRVPNSGYHFKIFRDSISTISDILHFLKAEIYQINIIQSP